MTARATFVEVSALAGDPARALMLDALMDDRALTAGELASVAGITPQTASGHLARLVAAGLVRVERQGRHRYHRLASAQVAHMLEVIMQVAGTLTPGTRRVATGPRDAAMRAARTCYDHLAGRLGVALTDALTARGYLELGVDAGHITEAGRAALVGLGLDMDAVAGRPGRRVLCRPCLDWSERRPHLAGSLGAALCTRAFDAGWIRRLEGTRAVAVTPKGGQALRAHLGVELASSG